MKTHEIEQVATVTLTKSPNVLTMEVARALRGAFRDLGENKSVNAAVITSSKSGVFCAGLDLKEFYQPNYDRVTTYWSEVSILPHPYGPKTIPDARFGLAKFRCRA